MHQAFPVTQLRTDHDDVSEIIADLLANGVDREFLPHVEAHLPRLHDLFVQLYGERPDGRERLASVVDLARR